MARKDALLRLHSRLITRRDALRKALSGDLDSLREYKSTFDVGDSVDAAVDTANDEISSQLAELESRELEQIEYALERLLQGDYGRCEVCAGRSPRRGSMPFRTPRRVSIASERANEPGTPSAGTAPGPGSTSPINRSRWTTPTATGTSTSPTWRWIRASRALSDRMPAGMPFEPPDHDPAARLVFRVE